MIEITFEKIRKGAKEPANWLYGVLFIAATYFAITEYGLDATLGLVVTVYCLLQVLRNYSRLQILVRNGFKLDNKQLLILVLTTIAVVLLVVFALNDYLSKFVLYGSIMMGIILPFLRAIEL